ncbi:tetratricopeptide repeat protein [Acidovorax sp. LjRoot118]|uniref:O-linked N-acetylglucosamine transferase, SPINDLY family protein n=1 Tax=Acidovorax sp. LjRoot118 TaxID=3342256 RepID=UPI003ED16706
MTHEPSNPLGLSQLYASREYAACLAMAQQELADNPHDVASQFWGGRSALALGQAALARQWAQECCQAHPGDVQMHLLLGDCLLLLADPAGALAVFEHALLLADAQLAASGQYAELVAVLCNKIGDVLYQLERFAQAHAAFARATTLHPGLGQAWFNQGITLLALGQGEPAEPALAQALQLGHSPRDTLSALGVSLIAQRKWHQAQGVLVRALAFDASDTMVLNNLALAHQNLGQLAQAEALIRRKLELEGRNANAWVHLGNVLREQGRGGEATAAFGSALQIDGRHFGALLGLAVLHREAQAISDAIACLEQALQNVPRSHPQYPDALAELGSAHAALGVHAPCEALFRQALALRPQDRQIWSKWFFVLNNHPDKTAEDIFAEYQAFQVRFQPAGQEALQAPVPAGGGTAKPRIHIGYVSADFTPHAVRHFLMPLLAHHDRTFFEVSAFAGMAGPDAVWAPYRNLVEHWHFTKGMTAPEVAALVREKGVDVLVDLSGHTAGNRLDVFALKPAPVSVSWMGFGSTTGLGAIDFYLSDAQALPEQDAPFFAEKPWRMDRPYLAYRPATGMGEVGGLPALAKGHVTFASLSRAIRFNEGLLAAWAHILERVPGSRLVLDCKNMQDAGFARRIEARFAALGIDASRIECGFHSPPWDVLRQVDITLDCFPHNSGTTLIESLYMGVPYVTLSGRPGVGRLGAAVLHGAGHAEWVAATEQEYVEKAVALASNLPALAALRADLRMQMEQGPLMDEAGFARAVEGAYVGMLAQARERTH